ncbi:LytR/AlgR family response regulator transcription factor [Mucilaginibacter paludis]|uniref:Two component transcriptional regulator, LytTR family n=1 Tax=Mucilaginibacter paludis DSM 18603 TaxID=714943 RepID=H1YI16_9SPHI|nr:LytTR family DNA-binding domain-containing protein [Mucilaginibacter paludis]EHQ25564.1 two component transcriptional regulator, LytTR family [Mucilaginibacter paludis DSM 18603]
MKKFECIIIDDEPFAINWLSNYINSMPNLNLLKSFTDPLQALIEIANGDMVDLILLDINMPKITGIDLSREIRKKTKKLIFSTAYKQYGYEAFEVEADAYLLKPYTISKFVGTLAKVFSVNDETSSVFLAPDEFFFVKNKDEDLKIVKINYSDVIAIESKQNYVQIHTLTRKVLTYMSLTEISKILRHLQNFVQFQRSFIIGKQHIDSIDGNTIKMVNGLKITVGDYYRKDFSAFLTERLIKAGRKR